MTTSAEFLYKLTGKTPVGAKAPASPASPTTGLGVRNVSSGGGKRTVPPRTTTSPPTPATPVVETPSDVISDITRSSFTNGVRNHPTPSETFRTFVRESVRENMPSREETVSNVRQSLYDAGYKGRLFGSSRGFTSITLNDGTVITGKTYSEIVNKIADIQEQRYERSIQSQAFQSFALNVLPSISETNRKVKSYVDRGYQIQRTPEGSYNITFPNKQQFAKLTPQQQDKILKEFQSTKEFKEFISSDRGKLQLDDTAKALSREGLGPLDLQTVQVLDYLKAERELAKQLMISEDFEKEHWSSLDLQTRVSRLGAEGMTSGALFIPSLAETGLSFVSGGKTPTPIKSFAEKRLSIGYSPSLFSVPFDETARSRIMESPARLSESILRTGSELLGFKVGSPFTYSPYVKPYIPQIKGYVRYSLGLPYGESLIYKPALRTQLYQTALQRVPGFQRFSTALTQFKEPGLMAKSVRKYPFYIGSDIAKYSKGLLGKEVVSYNLRSAKPLLSRGYDFLRTKAYQGLYEYPSVKSLSRVPKYWTPRTGEFRAGESYLPEYISSEYSPRLFPVSKLGKIPESRFSYKARGPYKLQLNVIEKPGGYLKSEAFYTQSSKYFKKLKPVIDKEKIGLEKNISFESPFMEYDIFRSETPFDIRFLPKKVTQAEKKTLIPKTRGGVQTPLTEYGKGPRILYPEFEKGLPASKFEGTYLGVKKLRPKAQIEPRTRIGRKAEPSYLYDFFEPETKSIFTTSIKQEPYYSRLTRQQYHDLVLDFEPYQTIRYPTGKGISPTTGELVGRGEISLTGLKFGEISLPSLGTLSLLGMKTKQATSQRLSSLSLQESMTRQESLQKQQQIQLQKQIQLQQPFQITIPLTQTKTITEPINILQPAPPIIPLTPFPEEPFKPIFPIEHTTRKKTKEPFSLKEPKKQKARYRQREFMISPYTFNLKPKATQKQPRTRKSSINIPTKPYTFKMVS